MTTHYNFAPDVERARLLDREMHQGLARSLAHIFDVCDEAGLRFERASLDGLIAGLERGDIYPPSTFALYYDLVPALSQDDVATAEKLLGLLAREQPTDGTIRALPLEALGENSERFARLLDSDPTARFPVFTAEPALAGPFAERFHRAMRRIDAVIPELAGEVRALVKDMIMVIGDSDAEYLFDGGSSFPLWGALFLNASSHQDDIAMISAIAHESAHSFLYGFYNEENVVENDESDRHPSPLREDLRPIEGIYHATFVSARMHWAMSRMIESGTLTDEEMVLAVEACDRDRQAFENGYGVVAAHGILTSTGRALMDAAVAYMHGSA